jgi:hypothetical protein
VNGQIGQIVDCEKQENSKEGWNATGIRIKKHREKSILANF